MLLEGFRRRGGHVSATACYFRGVTAFQVAKASQETEADVAEMLLKSGDVPVLKRSSDSISRHHQDNSSAFRTNYITFDISN